MIYWTRQVKEVRAPVSISGSTRFVHAADIQSISTSLSQSRRGSLSLPLCGVLPALPADLVRDSFMYPYQMEGVCDLGTVSPNHLIRSQPRTGSGPVAQMSRSQDAESSVWKPKHASTARFWARLLSGTMNGLLSRSLSPHITLSSLASAGPTGLCFSSFSKYTGLTGHH